MAAHSEASIPANRAASSTESPRAWRLCWTALAKMPAQNRRRRAKFAEGDIRDSKIVILIYSILLNSRRCQAFRRPWDFDLLERVWDQKPGYQSFGVFTQLGLATRTRTGKGILSWPTPTSLPTMSGCSTS